MAGTPGKSTVNILQEFSVSKYKINPNYIIKDVSPSIHTPRFEVTVEVGIISCSAQSANKKQAKEMCARIALDQLGLVVKTAPLTKFDLELPKGAETVGLEDATYNAVGYLNEYAGRNNIPYAEYNDVGTNEKGLMIIECKLGQLESHGLGPNKKTAKQNAAANLVKKLKGSKTTIKLEFPTPEKIRRVDSHQINSMTASAAIITNIKSEEVIIKEEKNEIVEEKSENPEEKQTPEKAQEIPETTETDSTTETDKTAETDKTEELSEQDILEDFRLKLFALGVKDDNHVTVLKKNNSYVLKYENQDINLNIVKISYDLKSSLDNIYDSIKERAQS